MANQSTILSELAKGGARICFHIVVPSNGRNPLYVKIE